jgi:hypothetical protein
MTAPRLFAVAAALVLTALLLACGKSKAPAPAAPAVAIPAGLPSPSTVLARSTSAAEPVLDGSEFETGAADFNDVAADGTDAVFAPMAGPGEENSLKGYAWAIYKLDASALGPLLWISVEDDLDFVTLGVADHVSDSWKFPGLFIDVEFNDDYGELELDNPDFLAGDGTLLIAVIVHPGRTLRLNSVGVSGIDEVEDNDTLETANILPGKNFRSFKGSVGERNGHPTYDGDNADWYSLDGTFTTGEQLEISLGALASFGMETFYTLYTASGEEIEEVSGVEGSADEVFVYEGPGFRSFTAADLPLKIKVEYDDGFDDFGGGNYVLHARSGFPPTAALTCTPREGETVPVTVTFDASGSTDPDANIVSYEWNFDDGTPNQITSEPTIQHEYTVIDNHKVSVLIRDASAYTSIARDTLYFGPNPYDENEDNTVEPWLDPSKALTGWMGNIGDTDLDDGEPVFLAYDGDRNDTFKLNLLPGETVRFNVEQLNGAGWLELVTQSDDEEEGGLKIWEYSSQVTSTRPAEHPFWVYISADSGGDVSPYGEYKLTWYKGTPPSDASFTYEHTGPLEITFHGTGTDSDGTIVRYEWSFQGGDVPATEGQDVVHTFSYPDEVSVKMVAFDDDGLAKVYWQDVTPQ